MIDIQEKKEKIISFLKTNGPSLPVRIAKAIEMDPVFASAITSELINSRQIKTSHIKIGSSPLYLLQGQEEKLEECTDNLKPIEKSTFLKLKENKLIVDEKEEPAIRVALRNIKDFAIPFKFQEKIMWKYAFTPNKEIEKLLYPPKKEPKQEIEKNNPIIKESEIETKTPIAKDNPKDIPKGWEIKKDEIKKIENIFTSPEVDEKKEEPEFLIETKKFLKQKNIEFLEEVRTEKKEIMAIINITSQLGNINFLLVAKNKKTITKDEVKAAIQIATKNNMPCLLITRKAPSKSIQKLIDGNHLIKIEIMK